MPILTVLIAALLLAAPAVSWAQPADARVSLDVPYVPQSEALCGGAAVAMVYRYWGDAHADAQQFAPLVDARAGGIADDVLVEAVRKHGWRTARASGSLEFLREQIAAGRPVIILVEDRPTRYHYVVVTGAGPEAVLIHDPSWGPSRRIAAADLQRVWAPTGFWALVVLPDGAAGAAVTRSANARAGAAIGAGQPEGGAPLEPGPSSACAALTDDAVGRVRNGGLGEADAAFAAVRARCPNAAGPLRELAGVRFAQRRWREAEGLAVQAVARDPSDGYAWNLLASSRFVQNDLHGALRAWNQIGQPLVDSVDITGLTHARYEAIARALQLLPHQVLTAEAFARAERRLGELPDRAGARIGFRPVEDGFASVDVALVERTAFPSGPAQWGMLTAKSLIRREIGIGVPGFTGQGEVWSAAWRWWAGRPRVAVAFTVPRAGLVPGVWRVDGSWESERYAAAGGMNTIAETRTHAGLAVSDWTSGHFRYGIGAGFDEWNGDWRTASGSATLERRLAGDRLAIAGDASMFFPVAGGAPFGTAAIRASAHTATSASRWMLTGTAGSAVVSARAPLALWPGAGDGHARTALVRAHPFLVDGTVGGPAFGRTLVHAGAELQRRLGYSLPVRIGIAGFVDAARATRTMKGADGPLHVDVGAGIRLKAPGTEGQLRVDFAHGLRDGANALRIAWQP